MNQELDRRVRELQSLLQTASGETQGLHAHIQEMDILLKGKDHKIKTLEGER